MSPKDAVDLHADDFQTLRIAGLTCEVAARRFVQKYIFGEEVGIGIQDLSTDAIRCQGCASRRNRVIMVLSGSLFGRAAEEIGGSSRSREAP
jgi:hypothetical protein